MDLMFGRNGGNNLPSQRTPVGTSLLRLSPGGEDTLGRNVMPQEFHRFGPENTFVLANDETSRAKVLEDTMEMALMFVKS